MSYCYTEFLQYLVCTVLALQSNPALEALLISLSGYANTSEIILTVFLR